MNDRRLGRFKIAKEVIDRYPLQATSVLSNIIIVRAEYMFEDDAIHYVGISSNFYPVKLGMTIPEYRCHFDHAKNYVEEWERLS